MARFTISGRQRAAYMGVPGQGTADVGERAAQGEGASTFA
jgi:hypothetical protein